MSKYSSFELAEIPLKTRMGVIAQLSTKIDLNKANNYGNKFREWIIENFPNDLKEHALNWNPMYEKENVKHVKKVLYLFAKYKDVPINYIGFLPNSFGKEKRSAEYISYSFNIYERLFEKDSYEDVLCTLSHESIHLFQEVYKTTLIREMVDKSSEFYVAPEEDMGIYELNPIEQEANIIGDIVSRNFLKDLKKSK